LLAAATWLVLATTGLVVLLVAMPALLRLGGLGPRALSGASDLPPPRPAPHPSLPGADLAGEDDEGREDGLMNLPPVPRQGGSLGADDPPGAEEPPSDEPPSARMRPAVVRRKATLHISDAEDTTATGEVQAGESVFVLREKGDWALVLRSGDEGVVMGWTEKSRLAIR
jgi:hypothetical protein